MRKIPAIAATVLAAAALCAVGCSTTSNNTGNSSEETPVSQMQADFKYNDSTVKLDKVMAYQDDNGYEHQLYVLVELDTTGLTDKDAYFFDDDVEYTMYVNGGKNELETDEMEDVDEKQGTGKLAVLYSYPDSNDDDVSQKDRESYEGTELNFTFRPDKENDPAQMQSCDGVVDQFSDEGDFAKEAGKFKLAFDD